MKLGEACPNIQSGKDQKEEGKIPLYGASKQLAYTRSASYSPPLILIGRVGESVGKLQWINIPCGVSDNALVIQGKELLKNTDMRYLLYCLTNSPFERYAGGSGQKVLAASHLKNIFIALPTLAEQKKIAGLLSLIDERIEVQNAIIKEQEAQKAALLRRLFDRSLRFPEFTDEWKKVKLGEVVICYSSTMTEGELQKEGGIPIYGAAGCCGYADVDEPFLESILIIKDGSGVGRSQYVTGPHYFLGTLNSLRTTSPTIYQKFVFYLLEQLNLKKYVCGSGIPHIYFSDYSKASCFLPSLAEQKKIAALLSAIDERLDVERAYAEQLKQQKAYLLRQMFI